MADAPALGEVGRPRRWWIWRRWRNRKVADPAFQSWASAFPLTRGVARREGERMFDLVAGFVHSQILQALVELDLLRICLDAPQGAGVLGRRTGVPVERMDALLRGAAALGLMEAVGRGWQTSRTGAALLGVPGLPQMIRHHAVLYRDLADPVALLRGEGETELARFWPYVFGAGAAADPGTASTYSDLMAETQGLVAEETLRAVSFAEATHVLDLGGGTGAFLSAVAGAAPDAQLTLFDLPAVLAGAEVRLAARGLAGRVRLVPGSFRDDPLPEGADTITLVRVLYDHADATVAALLAKVLAALPPGGRVVVSEPMSGGARPDRAGDAYFAFYCMAMQTGRVRSAARVGEMLRDAGFEGVAAPGTARPFVTTVVTARKPQAQ